MSSITEKDILNSVETINKLYDKLTYLDIYGTSVLIFIIITLFVFLVHSYCMVMLNAQAIKNDWVNQRCNPRIIPFAGFINKPDNKSIVDFTGENFSYCIQDVLTNITGYALQPFNFLVNFLVSVMNSIQASVDTIRVFITSLREKIQYIAEETLSRILNMLIPMQQIMIGIKDVMSKIQGILTAGLYTSLGTYYGLKSLMGAIAEFIIMILIALAAVIAGLWILPFTWPMAATLTAVFIAVAIPLTIIVIFMTEMLHIQTEGIPGIPSCFDKFTKIKMNDGTFKNIIDIEVGDILDQNNKVTSKIKVNTIGQTMYNLNDIIVSGSHILKYKDKWIPVKTHPDKKLIPYYKEPYLYCLNTTSKEIIIKDIIFTDWDEIYDNTLNKILQLPIINKNGNPDIVRSRENIHFYLDKGFIEGTKINIDNLDILIENIEIGTKINNDIVYGIVELGNLEISSRNNLLYNYHKNNDTLILQKNISTLNNKIYLDKPPKFYHLLTHSKKFKIGTQVFNDYNSLINLNLQK